VKCLVAVEDFPWPTTSGAQLRLVQVIKTIAQLGETDLFALTYPRRLDPCDLPDDLSLRRVKTLMGPKSDSSASRRLKWLASPGTPLELACVEPVRISSEFSSFADSKYDFVWCSRAATFDQLGRPRLGPTVVDIDDLEDVKERSRVALMWKDTSLRKPREVTHNLAASAQSILNARRWHALEVSVARAVDRVVVCSQLDATRLGEPNATVIPNGYDSPDEPVGRDEVQSPPTLLMQGSLMYGPNSDGAQWLVGTILPLIRAEIPDVQVRLVGDPGDLVLNLDDRPRVTVTGRVPSMLPELAMADLVVVPIRYGSGTRVKILESFAHRIPVVSTFLGAEGLDLEDGRQLLLAENASGFARSCVRALKDQDLRRRLVDAAHRHFIEHHQWSTAQARIRELAMEVAGAGSAGSISGHSGS